MSSSASFLRRTAVATALIVSGACVGLPAWAQAASSPDAGARPAPTQRPWKGPAGGQATCPHGMGMGMGMMAGPGGTQGAGGTWMGTGRKAERWMNRLQLTEEQRSRIRAIHQGTHADMLQQQQAMRTHHDRMQTLLTAPEVDAAAIEAERKAGLALHDQMSRRMVQAQTEVSRVLTPTQRARLTEQRLDRQAGVGRPAPGANLGPSGEPRRRHHGGPGMGGMGGMNGMGPGMGGMGPGAGAGTPAVPPAASAQP